jgi:hypothetical protein
MPTSKKAVVAPKPEKEQRRGKPTSIFLEDEDRKKLRELTDYLRDFRDSPISDSKAIKAALQLVEPNFEFLMAFDDVRKRDGRSKAKTVDD